MFNRETSQCKYLEILTGSIICEYLTQREINCWNHDIGMFKHRGVFNVGLILDDVLLELNVLALLLQEVQPISLYLHLLLRKLRLLLSVCIEQNIIQIIELHLGHLVLTLSSLDLLFLVQLGELLVLLHDQLGVALADEEAQCL